VRRQAGSLVLAGRLTEGADVVFDCVGSAASLTEALSLVRPRGKVVLVGMPGRVSVDLAPLWHRELTLVGAYAYGNEAPPGADRPERRSFELAIDLVGTAGWDAWSRPSTPSSATRRPWSTPGPPAAGVPSRWPSTSATRKDAPDEPRPGFVLDVDSSTPPTLFWQGERFTLEKLPEGSRVIYAPEPSTPHRPQAAIRHALTHPLGDQEPLPALLRGGMTLTIAFDDISLPLPPMERPDIRQLVIEQVSTWPPRPGSTTSSSSSPSPSTAG